MTDYDYIVVGAGSAGITAATRLTDSPNTRVLLLEAGGDDQIESVTIPAMWPTNLGGPLDWNYSSVPQKHAANTSYPWPRGKLLGGSSSLNACIWLRGDPSNFRSWVADGAVGWDYEDVLPFFKRIETTTGRDPEYRGTDGPLCVEPVAERHPVSVAMVNAAQEIGFKHNDDFNSVTTTGVGRFDLSMIDGRRQSTAVAYLRPALGRPNLTVIPHATARRVLFDGLRATGVEYEVAGQVQEATAAREIVLSGGAIGSPQLLMLSGVGPAEHLAELGIPLVRDLPVGDNLHDHILSGVTYRSKGPLPPTPSNWGDSSALYGSSYAKDEPDTQLLFIQLPFLPPHLPGPDHGYTVGVGLMKPRSRGSLRLRDTNPHTDPLLDPQYLADPVDVAILVEGLRKARELGESTSMEALRDTEVYPGPHAVTDEELAEFLTIGSGTYYHPAGTCRMGALDDESAVVDPKLRVRGIQGLRVADASVMPSVVSTNTNATSIMIGERVADFLQR